VQSNLHTQERPILNDAIRYKDQMYGLPTGVTGAWSRSGMNTHNTAKGALLGRCIPGCLLAACVVSVSALSSPHPSSLLPWGNLLLAHQAWVLLASSQFS